VFFYSPTDLMAQPAAEGPVGQARGLVEKGSVVKDGDGVTTRFRVIDLKEKSLPCL